MISSERFPAKGTEGQSECGFECEVGKYPHTQTYTHTVFFPSTQSLPIRLGGEATLRFGVQFSLVIKYFLFPQNLAVIHKIHH